MDCLKFSNWLENRDVHDLSEADVAVRHAESCEDCRAKLRFDEQLDTFIGKMLQKESMPDTLLNSIDLSLDTMTESRSKVKYQLFGVLSAAMAIVAVFVLSLSLTPSLPSMDEMGRHVIADHTVHDDSILVVDRIENLDRLGFADVAYQTVLEQISPAHTFVGARICPLGEKCKAVHLVFRRDNRRVSLYLIRADDVDFPLSADGRYTMNEGGNTVNFWKQGRYVYAMIG